MRISVCGTCTSACGEGNGNVEYGAYLGMSVAVAEWT